jgi:outer membrane usher protein FimD/PapC
MPSRLNLLFAFFALFAISIPSFAHHSFQAEYDASKPLTLTGTVTKLEWTNPHARFYVEVKDQSGKVTTWNFELASPNVLRRLGWNRDMMKPGDMVTVKGHQAKDNSNWANANSVTLPDGRTMSAGSSADEASSAAGK